MSRDAVSSTLFLMICLGIPVAIWLWRIERKRVAEETRQTVMASVMDAQNNLLNNLVYFRTCAETKGEFTPADAKQIDCAIHETQARLIEIAEADLDETRNLGGLRVLSPPKTKVAQL